MVNITDDSFYSASRTIDGDSVALRVRDVIEQGASIIDVGGSGFTCGAGLSLKKFKLGASWAKYHRSSSSLMFNVGYSFN
ncbi:MAG: dihydropteroate synthase [Bacteroidaceae bacterium]|nr:dihydropteroate synthase [Bacteroidaceae bacterium]